MNIEEYKRNFLRVNLEPRLEQEYRLQRLGPLRDFARAGIVLAIGLLTLIALVIYLTSPEAISADTLVTNVMWLYIVLGISLVGTYVPAHIAWQANWLLVPSGLITMHVYMTIVVASLSEERQLLNYAFSAIATGFAYILIRATVLQTLIICASASVYMVWSYNEMGLYSPVQLNQVIAHFSLANTAGFLVSILLSRADRVSWVLSRDLQVRGEEADRLLHNILPARVASQLKQHQGVIAESYADVTVGFADLVGFTELTATLTPHHLVSTLDDLFREFDAALLEEGAEKIKMIGDAYMFAVGVSQQTHDHALVATRVAERLITVVAKFREASDLTIDCRVGLASGTAIGGVICEHKFAFDLWGDTVNTAARMEQNANPGGILLASSTHEQVASHYPQLAARTIDVKGKGTMTVYALHPPGHTKSAAS